MFGVRVMLKNIPGSVLGKQFPVVLAGPCRARTQPFVLSLWPECFLPDRIPQYNTVAIYTA